MNGIGGLGGGRLGPDLTDAYDRLEGRKAISAWLGSPPSLVMQPVFKDHALEARRSSRSSPTSSPSRRARREVAPASTLEFVLFGFGGSVFLLLLFDFLWRKRYRATRRPLLDKSRARAMGSHS